MGYRTKKTFHFNAGVPRSGNTLLSALLNQNPKVYSGPLSPVLHVMGHTQDIFCDEESAAFPKPETFSRIISNVITEYYADRPEEIIIDKARKWPAYVDIIERYITKTPKIICTMRKPIEIISSFIQLIHSSPIGPSFVDKRLVEAKGPITDEYRCDYIFKSLSVSFDAIATAYKNNHFRHIQFVDYDELVAAPKEVMLKIHSFLELDAFDYDFNNIERTYWEKDLEVYNLPHMHDVRSTISRTSKHYSEVLSNDMVKSYENFSFLPPK